MKHDNNTQIPRELQPDTDYVRTTRLYALSVLGLVGEQIDEFVRLDRRLDWFEADPRRINRMPRIYKHLREKYERLNAA